MKIVDIKTVLSFVTVNQGVAIDCTVFEQVLETFDRHHNALLTVNDDLVLEFIKDNVCRIMGVSSSEFDSNMKYGKIGLARHTTCYVLSLLGYRNKDIAEIMNFSRPRVSAAISTVQELCSKHEDIKNVVNSLYLNTLRKLHNT